MGMSVHHCHLKLQNLGTVRPSKHMHSLQYSLEQKQAAEKRIMDFLSFPEAIYLQVVVHRLLF